MANFRKHDKNAHGETPFGRRQVFFGDPTFNSAANAAGDTTAAAKILKKARYYFTEDDFRKETGPRRRPSSTRLCRREAA